MIIPTTVWRLSWAVWALSLPLLAQTPTVPGRYIVELSVEPVADFVERHEGADKQATEAHRERVRAEQKTVRAELEKRHVRVLYAMDTVANALVVQSAGPAVEMSSIPGVKRVTAVRRMDLVEADDEQPPARLARRR
ncbi:MAG: hypothetical protein JNN08_06710 [Bryobacterales bacterium]|nr:hypothetical protein [Bryobacterales bacterium]